MCNVCHTYICSLCGQHDSRVHYRQDWHVPGVNSYSCSAYNIFNGDVPIEDLPTRFYSGHPCFTCRPDLNLTEFGYQDEPTGFPEPPSGQLANDPVWHAEYSTGVAQVASGVPLTVPGRACPLLAPPARPKKCGNCIKSGVETCKFSNAGERCDECASLGLRCHVDGKRQQGGKGQKSRKDTKSDNRSRPKFHGLEQQPKFEKCSRCVRLSAYCAWPDKTIECGRCFTDNRRTLQDVLYRPIDEPCVPYSHPSEQHAIPCLLPTWQSPATAGLRRIAPRLPPTQDPLPPEHNPAAFEMRRIAPKLPPIQNPPPPEQDPAAFGLRRIAPKPTLTQNPPTPDQNPAAFRLRRIAPTQSTSADAPHFPSFGFSGERPPTSEPKTTVADLSRTLQSASIVRSRQKQNTPSSEGSVRGSTSLESTTRPPRRKKTRTTKNAASAEKGSSREDPDKDPKGGSRRGDGQGGGNFAVNPTSGIRFPTW